MLKRNLLALFLMTSPAICLASPWRVPPAAMQEGVATDLVGTWKGDAGDAYAHQSVTLELRRDGTYTKTLNATVGNSTYGGVHEGRWTAEGRLVHLSGDSKWPPYTHDLSKFQKVQ